MITCQHCKFWEGHHKVTRTVFMPGEPIGVGLSPVDVEPLPIGTCLMLEEPMARVQIRLDPDVSENVDVSLETPFNFACNQAQPKETE